MLAWTLEASNVLRFASSHHHQYSYNLLLSEDDYLPYLHSLTGCDNIRTYAVDCLPCQLGHLSHTAIRYLLSNYQLASRPDSITEQ